MSYFQNSVVIITGAASGMGRELAWQASALGADVIAIDINEKGLQETKAMGSSPIQIFYLDVSDKNAIHAFAENIIPTLNGRKLILINNAGVGLISGNFQDTVLEDIEWVFNINFWGAVRLTKAFYPYFIQQNEGHIVNISSIFGLGGVAYQTAYSPSKFALRGFTETLRMELSGSGIATTSVHPGGIKTNITRGSRNNGKLSATHEIVSTQFEKMARTTAQKAAQKILKAIGKKQKRLLIGVDAKLFDLAVRLLPVSFTPIIKKAVEKTFHDPYKILQKINEG